MSSSVEISSMTFKRLQGHAVPLVDNPESVINRILDFYEARNGVPLVSNANSVENPILDPLHITNGIPARLLSNKNETQIKIFSPSSPPDLTHTKIIVVDFCNKALDHGQLNWNSLLVAAIRKAKSLVNSKSELNSLIKVNFVEFQKADEGYRYVADIGISIQQQDANKAWRASYQVAQELGLQLKVTFRWREKEGAAFPGMTGQLQIN